MTQFLFHQLPSFDVATACHDEQTLAESTVTTAQPVPNTRLLTIDHRSLPQPLANYMVQATETIDQKESLGVWGR